MIRAIAFISLLFGLAYVAFMQKEQVEKHDMNKAKNEVKKTHEQVDRMMESYEDSLQKNLDKIDR
jgi:type III secretory pathway component EscR